MKDDYSISLYRLLAVSLRHWGTVLLLPLGIGAASVLGSLLVRSRYASTATFLPETQSSRGQLPGLAGAVAAAAQLGLGLGPSGGQAPLLYIELVQSRRILGSLVQTQFPNPDRRRFGAADSLPLLRLLDLPRQSSPERELDAGIRFLRNKAVSVDVDLKTNLVTVSAESQYPALSQQMTARLLELVSAFNRNIRRSQAQARREFAERRAAEFEQALIEAERNLERFYSQNRSYRNSPELVFQEAQLQRQISIRQDLFLNMRREAEAARLEEVNDIPLLTVVDPPPVPVRRSYPKRAVLALFGVLVGLGIALVRVLVDPSLRAPSPSAEAEVEDLRAAWHTTRAQLRDLMRFRWRRAA